MSTDRIVRQLIKIHGKTQCRAIFLAGLDFLDRGAKGDDYPTKSKGDKSKESEEKCRE